MNNKSQFIQVLDRVQEGKKYNQDFELEFGKLRMTETGKLLSADRANVAVGSELTDFALTQLFTKSEMPVRYMKRMLKENPALVAEHFNYWMEKEATKEDKKRNVLLRGFYDRENAKSFKVRGVLSDKYTVLDNDEVLEGLVEVANDLPDFNIESLYDNDKKLHIRLSFNDKFANFGISPEGKNDIIKVGLDIQNSEIGYSSLIISPITYRLVCTNGLKMWRAEEGSLKQRHVHMTTFELKELMQGSMKVAIEKGEELLEGMKESRKVILTNPYDFIEEKSKIANLSKKQIEVVKANFDIEPEKNLFGIVNAFTRTARDTGSHDVRMNIESFASSLMLSA